MEEHQNPAPEGTPPLAANPKTQLSTPAAIIVAGALIMIGIIITRGTGTGTASAPKTLSEQVGVSTKALNECIAQTDTQALSDRIDASVNKAMSMYTKTERGTPYSIVIGPNNFRVEIRGAESYDTTKAIVDGAKQGQIARGLVTTRDANGNVKTEMADLTKLYTGNVALSEEGEHVQGPANAPITIIEYSDFECPYCKQFQPTMEKLIAAEPGTIRWVYRHYPLHQHSFAMLVAADCVAKLKGEAAFWKYGDLLFGLQDKQDEVSGKL